MAHDIECDTHKEPAGELMCLPGTPATTYVVFRWEGEDTYHHLHQCDNCADDIREGERQGELILIWCASLDDDGLVFSLPDRIEAA